MLCAQIPISRSPPGLKNRRHAIIVSTMRIGGLGVKTEVAEMWGPGPWKAPNLASSRNINMLPNRKQEKYDRQENEDDDIERQQIDNREDKTWSIWKLKLNIKKTTRVGRNKSCELTIKINWCITVTNSTLVHFIVIRVEQLNPRTFRHLHHTPQTLPSSHGIWHSIISCMIPTPPFIKRQIQACIPERRGALFSRGSEERGLL